MGGWRFCSTSRSGKMRCVEVRRGLHVAGWTIGACGILAPAVCRPHCTFRIGQTSAVARHEPKIAKQ